MKQNSKINRVRSLSIIGKMPLASRWKTAFSAIRPDLASTIWDRLRFQKAVILTSSVELLKTHMPRSPLHQTLFPQDQSFLVGRAGQAQNGRVLKKVPR